MKKYISIFVLIIVVILLFICIGYSFKLVVQKDKDVAALTQQNKDLNETIRDLNGQIESLQDEQKEQDEGEPDESSSIIPVFDENNIVNRPENTNIVEHIYANNGLLSVSVDNENNSLNIILDSQMARQIYGYNGQTENHTIAGISDKIIDAKIVSTGNDANGVKIVILLKNGTVKYIDIDSILNRVYNVKIVSNAEDIVSFVEVSIKNTENNDISFAVAGIKKDGSVVIFNFD